MRDIATFYLKNNNKKTSLFSFSLVEIYTANSGGDPTAELGTHSYPFILVVQWRAIFLPRNGGLRMASWRLALHHCGLPHCHHDIGGILSEVIP